MDKSTIIDLLRNSKDEFNIDQFVLFGSFAKGTQKDGSDIDIAYILQDGHKLNFDAFLKLEEKLVGSLKTKVDLMSFEKLNPLVKLNARKDFIYV
ncbi:MAG: nucleotidyltransferase domain-containing protein [Sulfuricurvum sp.]